jgi:hypothetical protein
MKTHCAPQVERNCQKSSSNITKQYQQHPFHSEPHCDGRTLTPSTTSGGSSKSSALLPFTSLLRCRVYMGKYLAPTVIQSSTHHVHTFAGDCATDLPSEPEAPRTRMRTSR